MSALRQELHDIERDVAELLGELTVVTAEAWKDGKLTSDEAFEIEQLQTLLDMANRQRAELYERFAEEHRAEEVENAADEAVDAVEDAADETADNVEDAASEAAKAVEDAANEAANEVEKAAERAAEEVEKAAEEATKAVEEAAEAASGAAEEAAEQAKQSVDEAAAEAAEAVEKAAEEAAKAVREAAEEAARDTEKTAEEAARAVEKAAAEAAKGVESAAAEATKAVEEAAKDAANAIEEANQAADESVDDVLEALLEGLEDDEEETASAFNFDDDQEEEEVQLGREDDQDDEEIQLSKNGPPVGTLGLTLEGKDDEAPDTHGGGGAAPEEQAAEDAKIKKDLSGSVGLGGKNQPDDTESVQRLLNQKGASLEPDGMVGPLTIGAIKKFQQANLGFADGRVDPGGKTWGALTGSGGGVQPSGPAPQQPQQPGGLAAPADQGGGTSVADFTGDFANASGGSGRDAAGDKEVETLVVGGGAEAETDDSDDDDKTHSDKKKDQDPALFGAFDGFEFEISSELGIGGKVALNPDGTIASRHLEYAPGGGVDFPFGKGVVAMSISLKPSVIEAKVIGDGLNVVIGKNNSAEFELKMVTKGAGFAGIGSQGADQIAAVGFELELEASQTPVKGKIDLDNLKKLATLQIGSDWPTRVTVGASFKLGAKIEGMFGASAMLKIREYDDLFSVGMGPQGFFDVRGGEGYQRLCADVQSAIDKVKEAVEHAKRDPRIMQTGPIGDVDAFLKMIDAKAHEAESGRMDVSEMADRIAAEQKRKEEEQAAAKRKHLEEMASEMERVSALSDLRDQEAAMNSGIQTLFRTPEFLGKANALANKDESLARKIYGAAWNQRALAKQAHDQYAPTPDSAPLDIIRARSAQASAISQKCQAAIAAFRQGDSMC